jgi:two-component system, sensor histidine kinase and response regulator
MAASAALKTDTKPAPISRRDDGKPRRVLYAEDQVSSRVVTTAMLERMGFVVEAVDDGEVAVERAREQAFDLILLDIEMPVMDGVTAARTIRAEIASHKDTPILALSAFLADSTENCAWREAFDTAVPKPANSNELQRAMARAITMHGGNVQKVSAQIHAASAMPIWKALQAELPKGMRRMMVETAATEMHHFVLALGAALQAGDADLQRQARHALKSLAANFEVEAVAALLADSKAQGGAFDGSALLTAIETWRKAAV